MARKGGAAMDNDQTRIRRLLRQAGCPPEMIRRFLAAGENGEAMLQKQILSQRQFELDEQIRSEERRIDSLDYLLYKIQRET